MGEQRELHFDVQGEFITQLAREQFFYEGKDYAHIMTLLLGCMEGTDQSEKELKRLAEDVLLGRAAFLGNTRDDTYHMEVYEPEEQPDVPDNNNIFLKVSKLMRELKDTKKELQKMQQWYCTAMEYVPEYQRDDVLRETGQQTERNLEMTMLNSFLERATDENTYSTEDYGWLQPDGTFHEVGWGDHGEWASQYVQTHVPEDFETITMQMNTNTGLLGETDWLVEQGWVLLHSPSQGIAKPTRNSGKNYTKAQQEFLYDYYTERGKTAEANAIYEEVPW